MGDRGAAMFNMELNVEVLELLIVELSAVVSDDDSREVELRDNRLPNKVSGLCFSYLGYWLSLHALSKIINHYKKELTLHQG